QRNFRVETGVSIPNAEQVLNTVVVVKFEDRERITLSRLGQTLPQVTIVALVFRGSKINFCRGSGPQDLSDPIRSGYRTLGQYRRTPSEKKTRWSQSFWYEVRIAARVSPYSIARNDRLQLPLRRTTRPLFSFTGG